MTKAFLVKRWFTWSDGEVRCTRCDYESYEDALDHFNRFAAMDGTTRVSLIKRGPKRSQSTLKVHSS